MLASLFFLIALQDSIFAESKHVKKMAPIASVGQVNSVTNQVIIERGGVPYAAQVGSPVTPKDMIETKEKSSAKLAMNDRSVLVIMPKTRFNVKEYLVRKPNMRIVELSEGHLRATIEKMQDANDKFEVQTPIATVGVRGTDFSIRHNSDQTTVTVFDGSIKAALKNAPATGVTVNSGFQAVLRKGGGPAKVRLLEQNELQKEMSTEIEPSAGGQK